jgi:xanthine/uracil permease
MAQESRPPTMLIACAVLAVVLLLNTLHHPWARMAAVPVALGLGWLICSLLGYLKPSPVQDSGSAAF